MRTDIWKAKFEEIEAKVKKSPKGTLTWKKIRGREQPYLQWTENGRTVSRYVRLDEREDVLRDVAERDAARDELRRLKEYYAGIRGLLTEKPYLGKKLYIGEQSFSSLIEKERFYVDKTYFIKEWWDSERQIQLITRPRRFGKTLTLSMTECFFSTRYSGRSDLFEPFHIWKYPEYRVLQGTYPVIFMTFAAVKAPDYRGAVSMIAQYMLSLFSEFSFIFSGDIIDEGTKTLCLETEKGLIAGNEAACRSALLILSEALYRYYGKKVIILIDEYDTPILEGDAFGYRNEIQELMRAVFNAALKSNPYLERALLTGILRVAKESLFSDMNNLYVAAVTSRDYADVFGFTEEEVEHALACQDSEEMEQVREWYDGFTFGGRKDIYNPWSIVNYLSSRSFELYWAHSGSYDLISRLVLRGKNELKEELAELLEGKSLHKTFNEAINLQELASDSEAIWPLLLATGYLKADHVRKGVKTTADLCITNKETRELLRDMVRQWFAVTREECGAFCRYLLEDDVELMTLYLNSIAVQMMSYFDVNRRPHEREPERFYHGFVLGLMVELRDDYEIRSNRESGFGRYDIMLRPRRAELDGIIIEFKVRDEKKEASLEETARAALLQIEEKRYSEELLAAGLTRDKIRRYGFVFEGKEVLIVKG